jgi:hypothetical protein
VGRRERPGPRARRHAADALHDAVTAVDIHQVSIFPDHAEADLAPKVVTV